MLHQLGDPEYPSGLEVFFLVHFRILIIFTVLLSTSRDGFVEGWIVVELQILRDQVPKKVDVPWRLLNEDVV